MFHVVYDSFESGPGGRDYVGKHSSMDPYDSYLGSYRDKSFSPDGKIIIAYAKTPEGAVWLEIQFQKVFGVVEDPQFANKSYQTDGKFIYGTPGENNPSKRLEVRQKISKAKLGKKRPDLVKSNLKNNPAKRPEVRKKMSESATGRKLSQAAKDKVSAFQLGRPKSEETKKKMREKRKEQHPPTKGKTLWCKQDGTRAMFSECPGPEWQKGRNWKG